MRVLHVITGLAAGGAETQLAQLLRHSDHHADVIALYNAGSVAAEIQTDGRAVLDLGMRSNRQVGVLGRLVRLIRAGRYDVVHTHLYRACLYGRIAARLGGVPVVVATEHSLLSDGRLEGRAVSRPVWALYRLAERCGDLTIAVSTAVHESLRRRGIPERRLATVPNGLELGRYRFQAAARDRVRTQLGLGRHTQVVGTVGRLHRWKNLDLALRAVAPLLGPDRAFVVIGDGPERAALTALADRLGVADRVRFTGERLDVPELLSALDAFVFPSANDTFGLAVIEALASGLPVVYQCCPALADCGPAVGSRLRAHRVRPDEAAYRAAVEAALTAPADRTMPAALDRFDIRATAARVQRLYGELLARRPGGAGAEAAGRWPAHRPGGRWSA
jgi:glycosyltransferase involved in cell wall biosynthesis